MYKRINISLPDETVVLIDRVTKRGDRSGLIDVAIRHYIETIGRAKLKRRVKEGALRRGQRDLQLATEWFAVDEEAWPNRQK
jgi:CopG family transcriptional regulator / antitoxin EndoAI